MTMRGRFIAGAAAGALLACSIVLLSFMAGAASPGMFLSPVTPASGGGSQTSASTTTTTVTYSSATSAEPSNGTRNATSEFSGTSTVPEPTGNSHGPLLSAVSGSSSLRSMATQPASADAFALLPLAVALVVGAALYRAAVRKNRGD